mmetsp:Transcript_15582/g.31524  ORF Transcript_15582/g.31524 Transcript_15582/m.31524 type:complete len:538 (-) Transcript_15582:541-2154(-)|eukprot:CAMPEP_0184685914 /NCGR_PEP_ID=MMETSP0312-20130426/20647_1 /TAXON_ID=31354 /ORGANISM="Compsopogon coeruleus, Strain SAG 36.94" /LENGTH=537 /DNA_ID=CAMNT_0027140485 /DNA_START=50 /DNA_END=1663 /DNA_ORIENTATION=-
MNTKGSRTSTRFYTLWTLILASVAFTVPVLGGPFRFVEVGPQVGINPLKDDKASGPSIADLNQDGYLDIVQSNHVVRPVSVYYGSASGRFRLTNAFVPRSDRHGTCVGDLDGNGKPDVMVVVGNAKMQPVIPQMRVSLTNETGDLFEASVNRTGLKYRGYLFACRMMDFDGDGDLDLFAQGGNTKNPRNNYFYENRGDGFFNQKPSGPVGMARFTGGYPHAYGYLVMDFDSDGFLDIFLFGQGIFLFKGRSGFQFTDVTDQILPSRFSQRTFNSGVAIDIDNDGDFDVYVTGGARLKDNGKEGNDLILENIGGRFIDASQRSILPSGGARVGVGAADFDNDGYMDIYLPTARGVNNTATRELDVMLRNNQRGGFVPFTDHGATGQARTTDITYPAGMQPFDFDNDGRVDVLVATRFNGNRDDWTIGSGLNSLDGKLQLFRNVISNGNHYFTVKVPVRVGGRTTMDATLKLQLSGGRWLYRKVGSVGEGRTQSFITHVHFGIGRSTSVLQLVLELHRGASISRNLRGQPVDTTYTLSI